MIHEEWPALIFMDLRLVAPEEGWNTLRMLRLDPTTQEIPIIASSVDVDLLRAKAPMLKELRCTVLEQPADLETVLGAIYEVIGPPSQNAHLFVNST